METEKNNVSFYPACNRNAYNNERAYTAGAELKRLKHGHVFACRDKMFAGTVDTEVCVRRVNNSLQRGDNGSPSLINAACKKQQSTCPDGIMHELG